VDTIVRPPGKKRNMRPRPDKTEDQLNHQHRWGIGQWEKVQAGNLGTQRKKNRRGDERGGRQGGVKCQKDLRGVRKRGKRQTKNYSAKKEKKTGPLGSQPH